MNADLSNFNFSPSDVTENLKSIKDEHGNAVKQGGLAAALKEHMKKDNLRKGFCVRESDGEGRL